MRYDWLDHVALDLEGEGYAVGAVSSPACGYGAPHKRQRLYWVADAGYNERPTRMPGSKQKLKESSWSRFTDNGNTGILGDSEISDGTISVRPEREQDFEPGRPGPTNGFWRDAEWLPCRDGEARPVQRETKSLFESLATRIAGDLGFVCNEGGQGFFSPLIQKTKNRVGRARGYGNAIVAPQAAAFIMAFMQKKGLI
jgi:DNA (cytosine-5)-methyltransferase 1